jgi:hypothetical protein
MPKKTPEPEKKQKYIPTGRRAGCIPKKDGEERTYVSTRPRLISPPPDDMEAMGREMIQWLDENQPFHLSEWYTIEKGYTYNQWKQFLQCKEFLPYYEIALKMVGKGYLNGKVDKSLSQRWQRVYFKDLREEENETMLEKLDAELEHKKLLIQFESQIRKELGSECTQEQVDAFARLLGQFKQAQDAIREE